MAVNKERIREVIEDLETAVEQIIEYYHENVGCSGMLSFNLSASCIPAVMNEKLTERFLEKREEFLSVQKTAKVYLSLLKKLYDTFPEIRPLEDTIRRLAYYEIVKSPRIPLKEIPDPEFGKLQISETEFSAHIKRVLLKVKINSVEDLTHVTYFDLFSHRGMGMQSVHEIETVLGKHGYRLKPYTVVEQPE